MGVKSQSEQTNKQTGPSDSHCQTKHALSLSALPKSLLNDRKGQGEMEDIGDDQQAKGFHESLEASGQVKSH